MVSDFIDSDLDITPISDVADLNDMQKIMKAQALRELVGMGLNDMEIFDRYLQALNIPDRQALLTGQPEKPDPKIQVQQMKGEIEQGKLAIKAKEQESKAEVDAAKAAKVQTDTLLVEERAKSLMLKREIEMLKQDLDSQKHMLEILKAQTDSDRADDDVFLKAADIDHQHEMDEIDRELEARKLEIEDKRASQKPATPAKKD
jgi:PAB1-binding protein PBP1